MNQRIWKLMNTIAGNDHFTTYPDKVEFARWAVSDIVESDLDTLDLRERLSCLVKFIRERCGLVNKPVAPKTG